MRYGIDSPSNDAKRCSVGATSSFSGIPVGLRVSRRDSHVAVSSSHASQVVRGDEKPKASRLPSGDRTRVSIIPRSGSSTRLTECERVGVVELQPGVALLVRVDDQCPAVPVADALEVPCVLEHVAPRLRLDLEPGDAGVCRARCSSRTGTTCESSLQAGAPEQRIVLVRRDQDGLAVDEVDEMEVVVAGAARSAGGRRASGRRARSRPPRSSRPRRRAAPRRSRASGRRRPGRGRCGGCRRTRACARRR